MVEQYGLGISLDHVFPDPAGVSSLMRLANELPPEVQERVGINERKAYEQWNGGIGFIIVTKNMEEAKKLLDIAQHLRYEAAIAGKVIDKPEVQFGQHTWRHSA